MKKERSIIINNNRIEPHIERERAVMRSNKAISIFPFDLISKIFCREKKREFIGVSIILKLNVCAHAYIIGFFWHGKRTGLYTKATAATTAIIQCGSKIEKRLK